MTFKSYSRTALFLAGLSLVACSDDAQQTTSTQPTSGAEETTVNAAQPANAPMDARRGNTPIMPKADYDRVEFAEASADLTREARQTLDQVAQDFQDKGPVLLTLRMKDEDTVDATEPREQYEKLTPERVTAVKNYLQHNGVEIEKVAVDETGSVEDMGEHAAMARAPSDDDAQHLIIMIGTKDPRASVSRQE